MPIDPALLELRARLEESGMVVVQEPDYLSVRLPYLCSVQIRYDNGRIKCEPFFGVVGRTRATLLKMIGTSTIAVGALLTYGVTPLPMALGVLVAASAGYDVLRTTVTENVVTRVLFIWSMMHDRQSSLLSAPMPEPAVRVRTAAGVRRDPMS
ncbi:MAG: hypothetical protein JWM41_4098 [Gemmatimonadetes bacterium]|nr:hypothetical protein [Gemmatimonadota bacterium]